MNNLILVRVSGGDKPGLTNTITTLMASYGIEILDIGQALIHDSLALSILIRIPEESGSAPVVKDLLFMAHNLGISLKCTPVSEDEYEKWVEEQQTERSIVTLISAKITAEQVSTVSSILAENNLNIEVITRLSARQSLTPGKSPRPACIEFFVSGHPGDALSIRKEFLELSSSLNLDIAMQRDNLYRRNRRLVAFDMDSTLIQAEVIDELAKVAGVGEEVSAITEEAMQGNLDFQQSFRKRLSLLKGLPESALKEVAEQLPLTDGAERLIANLKRFGFKIAILSGGFTYFGRILQEKLGIDYVYANELEIEDGVVTGNVKGDIVDAAKKAELLKQIAQKEDIDLQQVIAVGDGANDLPMLNLAGLGIAFHAKPVVRAGARQSISHLGLDSILYLIGVRERDTVV